MPPVLNYYPYAAGQGAIEDVPLQPIQHPPFNTTLIGSDGKPSLPPSRSGGSESAGLSTEQNSLTTILTFRNQPPSRQQSGLTSGIPQRVVSPQQQPLTRLIVHLIYPISTIIIMLIILPLSGTILKSPEQPDQTEWDVCGGRLGGLACIWVILLSLFCGLRYRGFILERQIRHQFPQDLYAAWVSPGPLSDLLPKPTAQRNPDAEFAQTRDDGIALPPLPQAQNYASWIFIFLLLGLSWSLAAIILLGKSSECLDSSPHIWRLLFAIVCLHFFALLVIALLWFIKLFPDLPSSR